MQQLRASLGLASRYWQYFSAPSSARACSASVLTLDGAAINCSSRKPVGQPMEGRKPRGVQILAVHQLCCSPCFLSLLLCQLAPPQQTAGPSSCTARRPRRKIMNEMLIDHEKRRGPQDLEHRAARYSARIFLAKEGDILGDPLHVSSSASWLAQRVSRCLSRFTCDRGQQLAVHDLLRRGGTLDRLSLKSRRVRPPAAPPRDGGKGAGRIRAGGRAVQGKAARVPNTQPEYATIDSL